MDANAAVLPFAATNKTYEVPGVNDAAYLPVLNEIIDVEQIDFVHAQPDPEVLFISRNRDKINAKTFLPPTQTVEVCMNKYATYESLLKAGVPVPATRMLRSHADIDAAEMEYGKPFWVRENVGAAGKGSFKAGGFHQALMWVDGINKGFGKFSASEYLPGRLFTWQALYKNGELLASQGRERLEWAVANRSISGVTGITGIARISNDPRLDEIGAAACHGVSPVPHGIYGVDMKENNDDVPCVTEINIGRFFTTIEFFSQAGLNFPDLYLRAAFGNVPTTPKIPEGYLWLRSMDCLPVLARE